VNVGTLTTLVEAGPRGKPAIVSPDDGGELSYEALAAEIEDLAGRLASIGVERGDRVAFVLRNGPEVVLVLLAIMALGAAAAPLNPAYTKDEFVFYLGDLAPKALLVPTGEFAAARSAAPPSILLAELARDGLSVTVAANDREISSPARFEPAEPDDIGLLLHTSGTTSRPKQVPLRHRNLVASARSTAAHYALTDADVSYCAMPLFHVHGIVASVLSAFAGGGSVVVPRRLGPRAFWRQIGTHRVSWVSAGPTLHQMFLDKSEGERASASLRFVRSCSSALAPDLMGRAEDVYSAPMLEAYGMTEASHQMASNPLPPGRRIPGSVGVATGTEIRIVDAGGQELAVGGVGEVVIRGPGVTSGYLGNPEASTEAFFGDWFRTGDRGVLDSDGYLRLEGRLKEMILRGGENVSPYEVEEALLRHHAVGDAVCFGVEDAKYGEEVAAAVVLTGDAEQRELLDHCRASLAAFKVPKALYIVESIPRTPTGKLQRKRVGALLTGQGR
jgi:acyl-CoA synthetase (AMP-forming)/AMP-acid ligase II